MGMGEILASIRRGFGGVLRFSGRDTRGQFWPYAIFVFLLTSALTYVAMIPDLLRMMAGFQRFVEKAQRDQAAGGPGAPLSGRMEGIPPELIPNFENTVIWSSILTVIAILLLAAAVTRRLHDRDKRGFWGLLPLPCYAVGLALAPQAVQMIARSPVGADTPLFNALMLNSFVYWGLLIFLVVILAGEGDAGSNRFGPAPEAELP